MELPHFQSIEKCFVPIQMIYCFVHYSYHSNYMKAPDDVALVSMHTSPWNVNENGDCERGLYRSIVRFCCDGGGGAAADDGSDSCS